MHVWTAKNWMHYSASHVCGYYGSTKMASEAISEHLISWGSMPPTPPPTLACLCMHAYTLDTPSENPGYGPVCVLVITQKVKSRRLGVNLPLVIRFQ